MRKGRLLICYICMMGYLRMLLEVLRLHGWEWKGMGNKLMPYFTLMEVLWWLCCVEVLLLLLMMGALMA